MFCLLWYFFWESQRPLPATSTQLDRHTKMRSMSCTSCLLCGLLVRGLYIHSNPHHSALLKKHVSFGGYSLFSFLTQTTLHCQPGAAPSQPWHHCKAEHQAQLCHGHCPVSQDKPGCQFCWETSTDRQVATPTQKDREMWISVEESKGILKAQGKSILTRHAHTLLV